MLSRLMKFKTFFFLLKFLQENNMNITIYISDKLNFFLNNTNANENSNNHF